MIVVVTRCYNEPPDIIHRFFKGYWWADKIVISDGNSSSSATLTTLMDYKFNEKVEVVGFNEQTEINGFLWNPDNPHIQHAIDAGKKYNPEWLILDDMDDVPNKDLREVARAKLEQAVFPQVNAFRLYLWGNDEFFPQMNGNFDLNYTSLWAWKPKEVDIHTDISQHHGTILGLSPDYVNLMLPMCLLHKSWHPDTIERKIAKYNAIGIPMHHPLEFAGKPERLPEWAVE